ncbi:hypothetical protein BGZ93_007371 [Podila epicladia]|nr:hypothetical protein BGZ93_007371 [Podila epicladia]
MKLLAAIASLAVLAVSQAIAEGAPTSTTTYTPLPTPAYPASVDCATSSSDQDVTAFTLTPSDYCIGKPYTVTSTGPLKFDIIAGARYSVTGKLYGRIAYTDHGDFCALLAAAGTPCPIAKTANALSFDLTVKPFLPANLPLQYTYSFTNGNNHIIFCRATTLAGKKCTV